MACKTISSLINRAGLVYAIQHTNETYTSDNCDGEDDDNDGVDGGGSSFKSDGRYYCCDWVLVDPMTANLFPNVFWTDATISN